MKDLTIDELEIMLEATGYLPPSNEDELAFFDQMYEDMEQEGLQPVLNDYVYV